MRPPDGVALSLRVNTRGKIMRNTLLKVVVLTTTLLASINANANLIINGGFEDPNINTGKWAWFTSNNVNGWEGSNIEIWDTYGGFQAFEGTQHAELNSHGQNGQPFSIFQTFSTVIGATYDLTFAYSARRSANETFSVNVQSGANSLIQDIVNDQLVREWQVYSAQFIATEVLTTLTFSAITPYTHTVGNLLDAVSVVETLVPAAAGSSVPGVVDEPMTLALLMTGIGFAVMRRKPLSLETIKSAS